ncbi:MULTISPECIES: hypothetical protein [Okeania]|nr:MULTISPECIES: hypothetical protein [unclassified Okeania]
MLKKSFSRGRRQLYWRQETGGTENYRGDSRKNSPLIFLPNS